MKYAMERMKLMYGVMVLISTIVRQFVLPNPFECFGDSAIVINLIAEPIIHAVAYGLVGLVYHRGESPALGSVLYLLAYATVTGILAIMDIFSFAWWWILIVLLCIVAIMVGVIRVKERFENA